MSNLELPKFSLIKQLFPPTKQVDVDQAVADEVARVGLLKPIKPGDKVAITAGSRGIDAKPAVVKAMVDQVKAVGGAPFIFPAMGSHGGGTADGQVEVLAHLGITEETVGAPIYKELEYVRVGEVEGMIPVVADRALVDADHIVIINRIKEHTDYVGETESGLIKMAAIGFGRQLNAENTHHLAVNITYYKALRTVARVLFDKLNVLGGMVILEDHHNQFRRVEAINAPDIFEREKALLAESKLWKPKVPFETLDILLVDEIGKEVSGTGADTKVVGRIMNIYENELTSPKFTRIIFRDLSKDTLGNAIGVGIADFITHRLRDAIDPVKTMLNAVTGCTPEKGRTPMSLPTDLAAMETALRTVGVWRPESLRVAWIVNTKKLTKLAVSEPLLKEVAANKDLETMGGLFDMPFDGEGNLPKLASLF